MRTGRVTVAVGLIVASFVGATSSGSTQAADIASITCDDVAATDPSSGEELGAYEPMAPERIVDTRNGIGGPTDDVDAGCTLVLDTTSFAPGGATAVALSVTVVTDTPGFFTVYGCGAGRPGTSSVNARPGVPTPNLVVAQPDALGRVCVYADSGGHVVLDVSGWFGDGANRFTPIEPVRAYDTRTLSAPVKLPAGAIRDVDVGGVLIPADAEAVAVNIAVVDPNSDGFLFVYPCGVVPPLASNLNFVAGERRAVSAIVEVPGSVPDPAAAGRICVTGNATTHFVVDVTGYYAPSSDFGPQITLDPVDDTRVVDTRSNARPGVRFVAGEVQEFSLASSIERPDETVAAVLNVVAVRADRPGFVSVSPCQETSPTTSSLNYDLGQTANLVLAPLSSDRSFCVFTSTNVDLVVDLVGAFAGPADSLLTQLSIADDAAGFVAVDQVFDPAAENHTVRCDGPQVWNVRLGLAPGAVATIDGVGVVTSDPAFPDVDVAVAAEGLMSVEVTRGGEAAEYHFRCVPTDFPRLAVERPGTPAPGWYLTDLGWNNPANGRFLAVLDDRGVPVWFKRTERKLIDFRMLSTGELISSPTTGTGFGIDPTAGHRVMGLDGKLIGPVRGTDDANFPVDHHDYVEIGTDGARAFLSYPLITGVDASTLPDAAMPIDPRCSYDSVAGADDAVLDGVIRELDANGDLVFEFRTSDHFGLDEVTYAQCFPNNYGLDEIDVFHLNSLARIDDGTGDYLVSARHLDAVFRVDRESGSVGDVEWILGSADPSAPNLSGAPRLTIVDDPLGGPLRMHDAQLNGNVLTLHDNRTATNESARIAYYQIDTVAMTATLIQQIQEPNGMTSTQLGSARLGPDASMLVAWGALQPMFVEYDGTGTELMRITMLTADSTYRIVKYGLDAFDAADLRANAGGSVEVPA